MSLLTDDYPATRSTSGKLSVGNSITGNFEDAGDEDWYAVELAGGISYLFTLRNNVTIPSLEVFGLELFDASGKQVAGQIEGTYSGPPVLNFVAPTTATYYVSAKNLYYGYGLGSYTLDAAVRTATDDFSASTSTVGTMPLNGSLMGTFEVAGDADWFRFRGEVGKHYSFTGEGPDFSQPSVPGAPTTWAAGYRILDASGREAGSAWSFDPTVTGDYYIEVLGLSEGRYKVVSKMWSDDYPDTPALAGNLAPGASVNAQIDYERDVDPFRVKLDAGGFYTFTLAAPFNYYMLELQDASGTRLDYSLGNTGGNGLQLNFHPKTSGDYFIEVSHSQQMMDITSALPYKLSLSAKTVDDIGDTPATAAAASIGVTARGTLQQGSDIDMFKYVLTAGTKYAFSLRGAGIASGSMRLDFLDTGGNMTNSGIGMLVEGAAPWYSFTPTVSGAYYLSASANYYQANEYQIKSLQLSGDTSGPALLSSTHPNNASGIALADRTITLTFNEPVKIADRGALTISDSSGQVLTVDNGGYPLQVDSTLVFRPYNGFFKPGVYTVSLPAAALTDLAGNKHTGPEKISFTTVLPVTAPSAGADLFAGGGGKAIDGGAGIDAVYYGSSASAGSVQRAGQGFTVRDNSAATDTLVNIERIFFTSTAFALDIDGNAGQAYRLYQAAFHRTPDWAGLGYWISKLDKGMALQDVAQLFVSSEEFKTLYGASPSDAAYINLLYNNVLNRSSDIAGYQYWSGILQNGYTRADVLAEFSESAENKAALVGVIGNGFEFLPY